MIEEPIDDVLQTLGVELIFDTFSIYGIPGITASRLYNGESSLYEVVKQDYSFKISVTDAAVKELEEDMEFSTTDSTYRYSFKLANSPIPNISGWAHLPVIYLGKEEIFEYTYVDLPSIILRPIAPFTFDLNDFSGLDNGVFTDNIFTFDIPGQGFDGGELFNNT